MFHNAEFVKSVDLSKPSLPALAYLLRNKHLWPEDFVWDYALTCSCAVGLSRAVWGENTNLRATSSDRWYAFAGADRGLGFPNVSPEMVAEDIEKTL